jgi:hypothetical protein
LNCPFCPSQALPKELSFSLWVGGFKLYAPMQSFKCASGHIFYVEKEAIDESKDSEEVFTGGQGCC